MSKHQKNIEAVLELLINEENEKAQELLHDIVVEKSRDIYEAIVDEADVALSEDVGGDPKEDFEDSIEADTDSVENDEEHEDGGSEDTDGEGENPFDGEDGSDDVEVDGDVEVEGEVEDRVEDLEAALADLKAQFDTLVADEMDEPQHADIAGDLGFEGGDDMEVGMDVETEEDFGGDVEVDGEGKIKSRRRYEEDVYESQIDEATKLQDQQAGQDLLKAGNKEEGKHVGTGKDSVSGETFKQSPYTNAPSKENYGGSHIVSNDGSSGKESGLPLGNGTPPVDEDNIDVKSSSVSKPSNEVKDDKGANKSPFTQKPKRK